VPRLREVPAALLNQTERSAGSARGTGGMYSKLCAGREASKNGVETWLIKGDEPNVLLDVAAGTALGTVIEPKTAKKGNRR
jgi:glutamate 5-kinase